MTTAGPPAAEAGAHSPDRPHRNREELNWKTIARRSVPSDCAAVRFKPTPTAAASSRSRRAHRGRRDDILCLPISRKHGAFARAVTGHHGLCPQRRVAEHGARLRRRQRAPRHQQPDRTRRVGRLRCRHPSGTAARRCMSIPASTASALALEDAAALAPRIKGDPHSGITLMMSHFACSETPDHPLNDKQTRACFAKCGCTIRGIPSSLANSSGDLSGRLGAFRSGATWARRSMASIRRRASPTPCSR